MSILFNLEAIECLAKLCEKFEKADDKSPHDYVRKFIQRNNNDDEKMSNYLEMFLELYKHDVFLTALSKAVYSKARGIENTHVKIMLYGILFRFDEYCFRKCLFKIESLFGSKLVKLLTEFFRKLDIILKIKNVAQKVYDISYVNEQIISPFLKWLPYVQESFTDYRNFQKLEVLKNKKSATIPMNMKVLSHQNRPKSTLNDGEMEKENKDSDTEKAITNLGIVTLAKTHENNLKIISRNHKKEADQLLQKALNLPGNYANKSKSEKYVETIEKIKSGRLAKTISFAKKVPNFSQTQIPIKTTVSSLLRFTSNIIKEQEQEIKWIETLCSGNFDSYAIDALQKEKIQQEEKDKINLIERQHLKGLMSYEDAILAKENLLKKNKEKHDQLIEEKRLWEKKLEEWKLLEQERIKVIVENSQKIDKAVKEAKEEAVNSKKVIAKIVRDTSDSLKKEVMMKKQVELEKKLLIIREIKALQVVAKATAKEKTFDFTETCGLGLMCEMSLVELRERLVFLKVEIKEELDARKECVLNLRNEAKDKECRARKIINEYLQDKKLAVKKKNVDHSDNILLDDLNDEISKLKSKLEEKRLLRMQLTKERSKIYK